MFKSTQGVLAASLALAGFLAGCGPASAGPPSAAAAAIPMKEDSGIYVVPVSVNGVVTIDCIVDSGASDVNIPAEVFRKLVRAGTIHPGDYLGTEDYTLADGTTESGRTFRIHALRVGNVVMTDVVASIGGTGSSALLGQSFLGRFHSWSSDNVHHTLMLVGPQSGPPPVETAEAPATRHPTGAGQHPDGDGGSSVPLDAADVAQVPSGEDNHTHRAPPSRQTDDTPDDDGLTSQSGP